jgi:hypothetical protein
MVIGRYKIVQILNAREQLLHCYVELISALLCSAANSCSLSIFVVLIVLMKNFSLRPTLINCVVCEKGKRRNSASKIVMILSWILGGVLVACLEKGSVFMPMFL